MTTVPIKDHSVALDHLLDARGAIFDVQCSTIAGTQLYNDCAAILTRIDKLLASLRRPK